MSWNGERKDDERSCHVDIEEHADGDYIEPKWEQKQTDLDGGQDRKYSASDS